MEKKQIIQADLSKIPCPFGSQQHAGRVETGSLQINDDWPGIFIRGDNAFAYVIYLNMAIDALEKMSVEQRESLDIFTIGTLRDLANLLSSSRI